jgi:hypothetical protein
MSKISGMIRRTVKKDGSYGFYDGRKKATTEQVKAHIKDNYQILDREKLSKENSSYLGRVKGGKNRAASAITDSKGKMLSGKFKQQVEKKLGVKLDELARLKGKDSIKELFKEEKVIKDRFDKILETGITMWYNSHKAVDKIMSANVKTYTLNGEEVTKEEMADFVSDFFINIQNAFNGVDCAIQFTFKGLNELALDLPEEDEISESEKSELMESYPIEIYTSPLKKKK